MVASERTLLAHLYRRAGFGATPHELDVAERIGYEASVRHLLNGLHEPDHGAPQVQPPQFLPFVTEHLPASSSQRGGEFLALTNWWIELMSSTSTPLREKLVLLLHCQFPTAFSKVIYPSLLFNQNQIFRQLGTGSFQTLTTAVAKDPAMLIWLDAGSDLAAHPNENFARELMERFAMGIGNYTETDVKEAARTFTGWTLDYTTGEFLFDYQQHDWGIKQILGHQGLFTGEDTIGIVTHTRASAHYVVSRLWSWLAYPVLPHHPVVESLAPEYAKGLNVGRLLDAILHHPEFVSGNSLNGLVKQPVEYVVGTLRALNLNPGSFPNGYLLTTLSHLGQELFNPPTVGGWGYNRFWLSTSASLSQLDFATQAASLADLSPIIDEAPRARVEKLANVLGVPGWSKGTRTALNAARANPTTLVPLALVSPEYLLN